MKVFISHSSKDKNRFVTKFAKRLREKGVEAWFDKWEMKVGDSIVDKIFEEGIKSCDSFIIILSKHSIKSKWVKEELDMGIINKIEKQTRIIPIIIDDDVEIPSALIATVWKRISNLNSYDNEFDEIVSSILGIYEKPPLGKLPKYAVDIATIGSLNPIDSKVLKIIVEYLLENNRWNRMISGQYIDSICVKNDISLEKLAESLEILNDCFYIEIAMTSEGWIGSPFTVSDSAIIEYCKNYLENFNEKVILVMSKIINENIMRSDQLAEHSSLHQIVICSLIEQWEAHKYIQFKTNFGDGIVRFQKLSVSGKRYFKEMLDQEIKLFDSN